MSIPEERYVDVTRPGETSGGANSGEVRDLKRRLDQHIGSGGQAHAVATETAAGFMSSDDKAKLDSVQNNATENMPDEYLLARGNQTGVQAIETVNGLREELDELGGAELEELTERAEYAADRAETASDSAFVNADVYPDVAAGLAAVADGGQFQVVEGDEVVRYRRDGEAEATEVARYPNSESLTGVWRAKDSEVVYVDDWGAEDETAFGVIGKDDRSPWHITMKGVVVQPSIQTGQINGNDIYELDGWSGFKYVIAGEGDKAPIAITDEGVVVLDAIKVNTINGAGVSDMKAPSYKIPESIHEWWIYPVHTMLSDPYQRIVSGAYGEMGEIFACETIPGVGVVKRVEVGRTPAVDDHNAPALYAESGRRFVIAWTRHGGDPYLRVRVSGRTGDLESFLDTPEVEIDTGGGYTYAQIFKIDHLSNDANDIFWVFGRHSSIGWGFLELSVNQATGALSHTQWRRLFYAVGYLSIAESNDGLGKLRVCLGENPANDNNEIYYIEIDKASGEISVPLNPSLTANVDGTGLPLSIKTSNPAIPATPETHSRRLFYSRPGPVSPAILYAEWPKDDPNAGVYKSAVFDGASWGVREHGPVGSRFGYVDTANYVAGASFPDPCGSDLMYIARHDDANGTSYLEELRVRSGEQFSRVISQRDDHRIARPIVPKRGSSLIGYSVISSYTPTSFRFTGNIEFTQINEVVQ